MKNNLPTITLKRDAIKNIDSIQLHFKYNDKLLTIIRGLNKFKWSNSRKCWHATFTQSTLKLIRQSFEGITTLVEDESLYTAPKLKKIKVDRKLSKENRVVLDSFIKYLEGRRYSRSTIETYSVFIGDFLEYLKEKSITDTTNRDVELFIEDVFIPKKYSISTHRQFVSAIKLFKVFFPECNIEEVNLIRPKKSKHLPTVLSQQEILMILQYTKNLKHRAVLALLYSSGLRIGELLNLELANIDVHRFQLVVKNSKGRKDRNVNMAESFIPLLNNYIQTYGPERYFVEGKPSKKYSAESIRKFLKKSCELAKIRKKVTPHTLRHTYATHLLENGTDIRLIQTLLGHSKPETTMIYTHVSTQSLDRITSPLDIAIKKYLDVNGSIKSLQLNSNEDM